MKRIRQIATDQTIVIIRENPPNAFNPRPIFVDEGKTFRPIGMPYVWR